MLSSRFDLRPFVLRCTKYIYQHEAINLPADAGLEGVGGLVYAIKILSVIAVIPQRYAFAAGNLPVVMFDIETSSPESEKIPIMNRICCTGNNFSIEATPRPGLRSYQRPVDVQLNRVNHVLPPCWPVDGPDRVIHSIRKTIMNCSPKRAWPALGYRLHAETRKDHCPSSRAAAAIRSQATTSDVRLRHFSCPYRVREPRSPYRRPSRISC